MGDNQQPQPEGHVVKCARCRNSPGFEPGSFDQRKCETCKGVGSVLLK